MTLRTVRIIGPTGHGLFEHVRVLSGYTGPTGLFEQVVQTSEDTRSVPTLCDVGLTGTKGFRTVVVDGYTGPSS